MVRSARGSIGSWDCRVDQPLGGAPRERDGTPDDTQAAAGGAGTHP
jgi:hypothetical protein